MTTRRVNVLALVIVCLAGAAVAQEDDVHLKNWTTPAFWQPLARVQEGEPGVQMQASALGLDPITAQASLRFSFGRFNDMDDVDALMEVLPGVVEKQRQMAPAAFR